MDNINGNIGSECGNFLSVRETEYHSGVSSTVLRLLVRGLHHNDINLDILRFAPTQVTWSTQPPRDRRKTRRTTSRSMATTCRKTKNLPTTKSMSTATSAGNSIRKRGGEDAYSHGSCRMNSEYSLYLLSSKTPRHCKEEPRHLKRVLRVSKELVQMQNSPKMRIRR